MYSDDSKLNVDHRRSRHVRASLTFAAGALLTLTTNVVLWAQSGSSQDVPEIEPTLTRLFSSDVLTVGQANINEWPNASTSPDGRWIVFVASDDGGGPATLWLVPAGGGEPHRLLEGDYLDIHPVWFPGSDRIAFRSTRQGLGPYVMALAIDRETGRSIGPPRQVTIDPIAQWGFSVSPDGNWLAYITGASRTSGLSLKIVPVNGGASRVLLERALGLWDPVWSRDGQSVVVMTKDETEPLQVMRVAVKDGATEVLSSSSVPFFLGPHGEYISRRIERRPGQPEVHEVATVDGRALGRFTLPASMRGDGFAPDGEGMLAIMTHTIAPLKMLPLEGGPIRQLTESRAFDVPLGWTPDSREVLFKTELDGRQVIMSSPRDGGVMQQVPVPAGAESGYGPVLSADGRYVLFGTSENADGRATLEILDREDGSRREVTRSAWGSHRRYNPSRAGDRFLYADLTADAYEFRAVHPEGESVLLRSFPADEFPPVIGVDGDRIAYAQTDGDSTVLLVARAGETRARRVLSVEGRLSSRGTSPPAWSPDGRLLALPYAAPEAADVDLMVVEIGQTDELVGEPLILPLSPGLPWWWNPTWLPDGRGLVVAGMGPQATETSVWLIPLDAGADPVNLTEDDPGEWFSFRLSPDGRYIAYSSQIERGSSIWHVGLGDVIADGDRQADDAAREP